MFRLFLVGEGFVFFHRCEDGCVDFAGVSFVGFDFPGDLFLTSQKEAKTFGLTIKYYSKGIIYYARFTT